METYRKKQTEIQKKVCYDFMRFRDSCSTKELFKGQYIAFFRAYLDTIQKALISASKQVFQKTRFASFTSKFDNICLTVFYFCLVACRKSQMVPRINNFAVSKSIPSHGCNITKQELSHSYEKIHSCNSESEFRNYFKSSEKQTA